jgi:hypothetical protein
VLLCALLPLLYAEEPSFQGARTTVLITAPLEGGNVEKNFDVIMSVDVVGLDSAAFRTNYERSFVCLSLDGAPAVCYPIFGLQKMPRFVGIGPGTHTIVAMLSDPETGYMQLDTSSGVRSFEVTEPEAPPMIAPPEGVEPGEAPPAPPVDPNKVPALELCWLCRP